MIGISVKADVKACVASLNDIARKQIPFATKTALNDVAFQVQTGERDNMTKVFKHPRPFTVRSVRTDKATKTNLVATVFVIPEAEKYIEPYEFGGVHVLPGPVLLNPKAVSLDPYGQLRKGTVKRIDARARVFFGTIHGVTGFWLRPPKSARNGRLTLLLRFGGALPVKTHLHFHDRAVAIVKATFVNAFRTALVKAISTAKKTP